MRIDDRLIHGQVVAVWCKHLRIDRIVIVDDRVAADGFMQEVLKLAAPRGIRLDVYSMADGIRALGRSEHPSTASLAPPDPRPGSAQEAAPATFAQGAGRSTTMILVKTPQAARQLYDGGLPFEALNVGGIGSAPGRKNVFKNIAISEQELADLRCLHDRGVRITLLTVPGERSKPFAELMGK